MKKIYRSYKDSGIEWMGKIPIDWKLTKNRYGFLKYKNNKNESDDTNVLSLTINGIKIKTNLNFGKSTESYIGHQLVEKGDIVFTPRDFDQTPILSDVSKYDGCISNLYIVDKTKKGVLNHFVNYFWYGLKYSVNYFKNFSHGIRYSFNRFQFDEIPLLIPPFSEQEQIVSYLDKKTFIINSLIEKSQKKIELLNEKRTSLINEVVTKGLNSDIAMKDSGVEWIGKIPKEWSVKKLKYFCKLVNEKGATREGDIKISPENVESNTGRCLNLYSEYSGDGVKFKEGDILLNKLRLYLKKILFTEFDGYSMGEMIVLRIFDAENKYYFKTFFHQGLIDELDNQSTGVKVPRVSPEIIMNTKFPYPPLSDQKKIVSYLDKQMNFIDKKIKIEMKRIELLKEYMQSLISSVVTGKIRVTN
ncbi:restriction endonuclease subunit S [Candidatus Pelagibacter ubique]|uniref:restriction endonuclease subunit S n=1 Tax=Pelagibacter ubique TaxID=198252 RepID=UPI0003D1C043